jgi:RNA polymerase sigma factor (sigma-70 family)
VGPGSGPLSGGGIRSRTHVASRGTRRPLELGEPFEEVLAAAQSGAPCATRHIYEALAGRVCGYLRAQGTLDPEALTNEVFLRIFRHLVDFVGAEAQFRAWVFSIAHHLVIDERRRRSVRPQTKELGLAVAEAVRGGDAEQEAIIRLERVEIARLLATLTPEQRDVITLRVLGDLSIEEVARALSRRPGSIKALQRRGLTALRHRLGAAT